MSDTAALFIEIHWYTFEVTQYLKFDYALDTLVNGIGGQHIGMTANNVVLMGLSNNSGIRLLAVDTSGVGGVLGWAADLGDPDSSGQVRVNRMRRCNSATSNIELAGSV